MPFVFVFLGVIVLLVLVVLGMVAGIYNRLVQLNARIDNAWSQIDVQLRRRYDLIPNLVETVKGYAAHERETLERVIQARNMAVNAKGVAEQGEAENVLTGALKSLFAVAEAYPDLKANQNFMQLQEEISGTESKIAYARQFYNDTVMTYNTTIGQVPSNIIANMFNFGKREYFELEGTPEAREAPKVSFGEPPYVQPPASQPPASQPPASPPQA